MSHYKVSRRNVLRGLGGAAISLPLLAEFSIGAAQAPTIPRCITLFFGLGMHQDWQKDFTSSLEPLSFLAKKMAAFSVEFSQSTGGFAHCKTGSTVFVGERPKNESLAGGPTLDQRMRAALDPAGPTLTSGLWWRQGVCDGQSIRVRYPDGTGRPPIKRPSKVFEALFGTTVPTGSPTPTDDPAARRAMRTRRSVLDAVMDEYRHWSGANSPLGTASKLKLEQHLTAIREIERRLAPADDIIDGGEMDPSNAPSCRAATRPSDPGIADYDKFSYGTDEGALNMNWRDFQQVYRLHADLWALGLRCDLVRFGNLMFAAAGDHMNLEGTYQALGETTDWPGTGSAHDEYFHDDKGLTPDERTKHGRLYQHWTMSNLACLLKQLDDSTQLEPNGKTLLDNSCVVIGTEYGYMHSEERAFSAVVGGGGRFKSGFFTDRRMNCIDLYNAILAGYGLPPTIGQATGVESEGDGTVLLA